MAADEIERFRSEIVERTGDRRAAESLSDQDLFREVMNTVGRQGRLGDSIPCVVSVSMLTEGWDASTVTHVLGVRAFVTQLLCEKVIRRPCACSHATQTLRDASTSSTRTCSASPSTSRPNRSSPPPPPPRETVQVRAMRPERDAMEIRFPRVAGYRVELPEERDHPEHRHPRRGVEPGLDHLDDTRTSSGATPARPRSSTSSARSSASPRVAGGTTSGPWAAGPSPS